MKREIVLTDKNDLFRTAVLEDGELVQYSEEKAGSDRVGNIYIGRVENVVKGMDAVFLDIGGEKNAFMPLEGMAMPSRGSVVPVQVIKEELGEKGARVTRLIKLPGTYLVLLIGQPTIGVAKTIASESDKARLREIGKELTRGTEYGVILRSAALRAEQDELAREFDALRETWEEAYGAVKYLKPPLLVLGSGGREAQLARAYAADRDTTFITDSAEIAHRLIKAAPDAAPRVKTDAEFSDIMMAYGVPSQVRRLFRRKVYLKSGGYLVIDRTEAMTVIDVNSGTCVRGENAEEVMLRVNCEAARECARQLRLRDIGGITIIDFIDLIKKEDRETLLREMREALLSDTSRASVAGITNLGLVEITRARTRTGYESAKTVVCEVCGGEGRLPLDRLTDIEDTLYDRETEDGTAGGDK